MRVSVLRDGAGMAALLALVVLITSLPLGRLATAALAPAGRWDPSGALAEISTRAALTATWNTVEIGVISALGALVIGALFATLVAVTDVRCKRPLAFLFVLSLLVAPQVVALAFKSLLGPASPLLEAIGLARAPGASNPMLGRGGIIVVLALHHAPLVAVTLMPGLRAIPRPLVEAAMIEGAGPVSIARRILLPLLRHHLAAAGLLAFVAGAGNFGIPALLGMPVNYLTLPTLIYRRLTSYGPDVLGDLAALALLVGALAVAGVLASALILRRAPREVESADHTLEPFWRLGRRRLVVEALLWAIVVVGAVVPFLSLLATALVPALGVPLGPATATLDNFREVLLRQDVTRRAARNSIALSAAAAILTTGLSVVAAYALERAARRWRSAALVLIELPYAIPGIVLAIACILLFLRPLPLIGLSLYGTPLIILFAYVARFLALSLKPTVAAMALVSREPEEAAALDGAGLRQRLRHVVVPSLLPAAIAGGLLVFLLALNELTVSALLWTAGLETLGVALMSFEEAGLAGHAAALGVAATILVAAIMLAIDRIARSTTADAVPWAGLARRR